MIISTCLIASLMLFAGVSQAFTVEGETGQRLDTYLSRIVPFGFSGAVLVAKDGKVILERGYGLAIRSSGTPNTSDTVFGTGSLTKQFTAAAILQLETAGRLQTDDPITKHLAGVPGDKAGITIHHLLTHTSGLPGHSGYDYDEAPRDPTVRHILKMPLDFSPGSEMSYSNCGYTLLAAIVEIVSGESYEQFLRTRLFQPAGMTFTGYKIPDWNTRVVAHWYVGDTDNGRPLDKPFPYWNLLGNGGILSTTGDMYRWYLALQSDRVLTSAAKNKLWTPFLNEYAYGWDVIETDTGDTLIRHDGGSMLGNSAVMSWFINEKLVIIIFCNQSYGHMPLFEVIEEKVKAVVRGEIFDVPTVSDHSAESLAAYEGSYQLPGGGRIEATVSNGALLLSAVGQRAIDALLFPNSGKAGNFDELNDRTRALAEGAIRNDPAPFENELQDSARAARFKAIISRHINQTERMLGAKVTGVEIIGTVPTPYGEAVATGMRFLSDAGADGQLSIHWLRGKLAGLDTQTFEPAVPFLPAEDGSLAGYHLVWAKQIRIQPQVTASGEVFGLKLGHGVAAEMK